MFQPSEVELGVTTKAILAEVERTKPRRVVIDSLSEMRLLAQSPLRYRRQILALKQFFIGRECTVFLLDDLTSETEDLQLQSIAHGVVSLEQLSPEYGAERRRLRVMKLRGQKYRGGYHDFVIADGRARRLPPARRRRARPRPEAGPAQVRQRGAGRPPGRGPRSTAPAPSSSARPGAASRRSPSSTPGPRRAAASGPSSSPSTSGWRPSSSGRRASGWTSPSTSSRATSPSSRSTRPSSRPGEFAHRVRRAAEGEGGKPGAKVVVIDSLNGYLNAMPEERFLTAQLHELLTYLGHKGVVTFLLVAQHGLVGQMETPVDTTYLADTVILFRYFEAMGEVRQAISVVKKRSGKHERTIRELSLGSRRDQRRRAARATSTACSPGRRRTAGRTGRSRGRRMSEERPTSSRSESSCSPRRRGTPPRPGPPRGRGACAAPSARTVEDVCREVGRGAGRRHRPRGGRPGRQGGLPRRGS